MSDPQDRLKEIIDEHEIKKDIKSHRETFRDVRAMISDCQYFKSHIERTRTTPGMFSFDLRLSLSGSIHDFFFRKIESYIMNDLLRDEDSLLNFIRIYHLLVLFIERAKGGKNEDIKNLLEFSEIVEWHYGLKLDDYLHAFIGCSHAIDELEKSIKKYKKKETT